MVAHVVGGLVVTPDGVRGGDIDLKEGRIAALRPPGVAGRDALDAHGCYVLPGGVDPHTHLLADIASAARSAAFGGTTTAISFTLPQEGESPAEAVVRARDELVPRAVVDVALHAYVSAPDRLTREDVEEAAALGVTGVKLFTAYPELGLQASDRTVYETMRAASRLGLPVLVHCENGGLIAALVDELLAAGRRDVRAFADSRPPETEVEAIARVLAIAELAGGRVYIVHISTAGGVDAIREARRRGVEVTAEACAHHLALDASVYDRPDPERYLTVPPLRPRENRESLWAAVRDGTLDTIGSDHAQARFQPEPQTDDFTGLAYGLAGVEARFPVVLSEGRARGVPLERLAELLATGPARAFGLYPSKGVVAPGADADLVVWDPDAEWTVERSSFGDGAGDSPYEGLRIRGRIRHVIRRGELLVAEGELQGDASGGRFLPARAAVADPEPTPV
jgi:dihydropyrimidinase